MCISSPSRPIRSSCFGTLVKSLADEPESGGDASELDAPEPNPAGTQTLYPARVLARLSSTRSPDRVLALRVFVLGLEPDAEAGAAADSGLSDLEVESAVAVEILAFSERCTRGFVDVSLEFKLEDDPV